MIGGARRAQLFQTARPISVLLVQRPADSLAAMSYRGAPILLTIITLSLPACNGKIDDTDGTTAETSASTAASTGPTTAATTGPTTTEATTGPTTGPTTAASTGPTTSPTTEASTGPTTGPTTGAAACPDAFPAEGAACDTEGLSCKISDCQSPCEGCNYVLCDGGVWVDGGSEEPGTCLECDAVCDFVVLAGCAGGPPDKAACVAGCMDTLAGACKLAFDQTRFCVGETPTFTCDDATRPTVVGCEDLFDELYMCMDL